MKEYKVLEMSFYGEKDLENTLNDYAKDGWIVASILPTKTKIFSFEHTTEELTIVFER